MENLLKSKNDYMHHYKNEKAQAEWGHEGTHVGRTSKAFGFDKINEMDKDPEEMNADRPDNYCQKCKYESRWCKHRKLRDAPKDQ